MRELPQRGSVLAHLCAWVLLVGVLQSAPAASQTPQNDGEFAQVVVSVQRRLQNIQDVGTSITALQADEIQAMGSRDITALASRVPALQFNQFSPAVTVFNIRGVSQNDYGLHQESPIAVYLDDAYVSVMGAVGGQMFDLAGVEIARGPQGTLFGRNATGGLIHLISAKPTSTAAGYFSVTGGSNDQLNAEGAFGGPLTDWLRGRLSVATNYNSGYMTNRTGPDLGNTNNHALRAQLEADLSSDAKFLLNLRGSRNDHERYGLYSWQAAAPSNFGGLGRFMDDTENVWGTCTGCDASGYRNPSSNPFNQAHNEQMYFNRTVGGVSGTFTWALPAATLVSVSDYTHMSLSYREDSDASPNAVFAFQPSQTLSQYSEELRLSGEAGALNWLTGFYYLHIDSDDRIRSDAYPTVAEVPYDVSTSSWALFGQAEYRWTPKWSAILGLRYSSDEKRENYRLFVDQVLQVQFDSTTDPDLAHRTFDGVSGKLELDYKPTSNALVYASYNRGIKGGGFAAPSFPPVDPSKLPHRQEVLTDYETGLKLTLLNGAARLNASLFYYDYADYQAFSFFNFAAAITNRDAIVKGGELELAAQPLQGLTIQAGASHLQTEVKHVVLPDGVTEVSRVMPQAPSNSFSLLLRYERPLGAGTASIQTDWKHDSSQYFTVINAFDEFEASRTYGNVRLGYTFANAWEVALFVNNVTDRHYSIFRSDFSPIGVAENVLAKPRWYGISLSGRFGQQ